MESSLAAMAEALRLKRSGQHYRGPCPVHGGGKSPFALGAGEGGRLLVHCHAGCDPARILAAIRARFGAAVDPMTAAAPRATKLRPPPAPRDWSPVAESLWAQGEALPGTLAETYLAARGVPPEIAAAAHDLRFLAAEGFGPFPCLMARITDCVTARPISLHFTRLAMDGTAKAPVERPKLLLAGHRKQGGCIRLSPDDDVTTGLGLAEGIETALAVMHRLDWRPVWATVDAGNMARFPLLDGIEALTLFADHDAAGLNAAQACARRWREAGRQALIATPTEEGFDFADLNQEEERA